MSRAVRIFQGAFGRVALLDMTAPLVRHAHGECHVLIKAGGADTVFRVSGVAHALVDGTAVLVNAWEPHAYEHAAGAPSSLLLALYIDPRWVALLHGSFRGAGRRDFFAAPHVPLAADERRSAAALAEAMAFDGALDEAALERLMGALVLRFSGLRGAPLAQTLLPAPDRRVRRAVEFVRAARGVLPDIAALARSSGISRPHFFELFRRDTGVTPQVFANAIRMEVAMARLAADDEPVGGLSDELGFAAPPHFSRFFRQHLGVAPVDYRRTVEVVGRAANPTLG